MARIWISEIEFSDNSKIQFDKNDITVFVGPNNAGKSASLKESAEILRTKNFRNRKVLIDLMLEKEGDADELLSHLDLSSTKFIEGTNPEPTYIGYGYNFYSGGVKQFWNNYQNGLSELFSVFVHTLTTEQRLTAANPAPNIKLTTGAVTHPIHFLQKDDDLEKKFSDYFHQAFGQDLIIHRNAGNEVPLYVGKKPVPQEGEDRVSQSYIKELEKLDLLHEQGDGMRSFVGVLLNAFISSHSMLFIDEPEAFLHPPQARLLGKMIAKDLPSDRQLFLATHSEDFLKGLLDANTDNLKIIRIQRNRAVNNVSILNSSDINEIWKDSLLRHSNILSGLFHSKVVICESDSDSRFYSAILSAIHDGTDSISPDILFINCGGKHRIPVAVKALAKLNVPVNVIADFDVLNDISPLKEIFEELGGEWTEIQSDWNLVKASIEQKRPELEKEDLKTEIESIFQTIEDRIMPKQKISEIQKVLKRTSAWSHAKSIGKSFIPSGDPTQAFERLQTKLKEKGLLIVDVGEVESFVRSIGNKGPKWVNEVLEKDLANDSELEVARQFVRQLLN